MSSYEQVAQKYCSLCFTGLAEALGPRCSRRPRPTSSVICHLPNTWSTRSLPRASLVFIGPPGVGKTHLAVGIALKAIEAGYKVLFTSALGLIEMLELAQFKGELKKKIASLLKFDALVLDELGYLPMNKPSLYNLFQLINAMYEYRSLIITTNQDFTSWHEFFFDDNVAVPLVDRIIHHSTLFMLGGDSYRLKQKLNG